MKLDEHATVEMNQQVDSKDRTMHYRNERLLISQQKDERGRAMR